MDEVRLIDANAELHWLESKIIDEEESDGISPFIVATTLKEVRRHIKDAPTVDFGFSCWKTSDELPPLHHATDTEGEDAMPYEISEPLLVYTEDGETVSEVRYVKYDGFAGWDDATGYLYGKTVTHWMQQPKPPKEEPHG